MADAIQNKINHTDTAPSLKRALIPIAANSTKAALTIQTSGGTVHALRSQLCSVCRDGNLYPCDKAEGWSPNCAFVGANSK